MMARGRFLSVFLAISLLANTFCTPTAPRLRRDLADNEIDTQDLTPAASEIKSSYRSDENKKEQDTPDPFDDDDDFDEPIHLAPTNNGGSNIFSLLNLVSALFPGSSNSNIFIRNIMQDFITRNQVSFYGRRQNFARGITDFLINNKALITRRQDTKDNEIEIDYFTNLKTPPFQKQENEDSKEDSEDSDNDSKSDGSNEETDNVAEESTEDEVDSENSASNANSDESEDSDDSDEPPGGGDGQGGGILGVLAGLSGGENGESDLGSLLATVGGIVANLSGDGIDINALIASGLGLFVGLLSEGEENPGSVIASYLLTSLDTITGGGSKNNGAFFGNLISKLIKGTSAAGNPDASSEENGNGTQMKDSAGFIASLLMSILGDMSKGSSGSSSNPS